MIKFLTGVIAGAIAAIVGAWVWIVRHVQDNNQTPPAADPEEE